MANIINYRFKVHDNPDNKIYHKELTWQTTVKEAIPIIKKELEAQNNPISNIELYVDDPKLPEKSWN